MKTLGHRMDSRKLLFPPVHKDKYDNPIRALGAVRVPKACVSFLPQCSFGSASLSLETSGSITGTEYGKDMSRKSKQLKVVRG